MKKFIILSSQRSGSTYLKHLLNSHPEIFVEGEIFNTKTHIIKKNLLTKNYVHLKNFDHEEYIRKFFLTNATRYKSECTVQVTSGLKAYGSMPSSTRLKNMVNCFGFKLFYNHGNKRRLIWKILRNTSDFSLIHLQRKNTLKKLLSLKLAKKTSSWTREKIEPGIIYEPIYIDYQECLEYFIKHEKSVKEAAYFFRNTKKIDIFYEDLAYDRNSETNKVLKFLGFKPEMLTSHLMEQNKQNLSEIISNYFELKNKFKNTDYEVYFED